MSEDNQDANVGTADSSAQSTPDTGNASTPGTANVSQDQTKGNGDSTPFHEHPRFKELISEKNQLRSRIEELQSQLTGITSKKEDPIERVVQKYVKAGMKEDAARLIAEGSAELAGAKVEERVAPVEASTMQAQSDLWFTQFAETHKDYEEMRPKMAELFNSLPEPIKRGLSAHPQGLKFLYNEVKADNFDAEIKKAFEKGVQEGYRKKTDKSAVSPSTGASAGSPKGEYSEEDIRKMSTEDYLKNRTAIFASKGLR